MLDLFMMFSYTQDKAAIAIDALWRIIILFYVCAIFRRKHCTADSVYGRFFWRNLCRSIKSRDETKIARVRSVFSCHHVVIETRHCVVATWCADDNYFKHEMTSHVAQQGPLRKTTRNWILIRHATECYVSRCSHTFVNWTRSSAVAKRPCDMQLRGSVLAKI